MPYLLIIFFEYPSEIYLNPHFDKALNVLSSYEWDGAKNTSVYTLWDSSISFPFFIFSYYLIKECPANSDLKPQLILPLVFVS